MSVRQSTETNRSKPKTFPVKFTLHKKEYLPGERPTTSFRARFDAEGTLLDALKFAQCGAVGWGPWQTQKKYNTAFGPAWDVTTAGHGGIILIAQTKIPYMEPVNSFEFNVAQSSYPALQKPIGVKVFIYEFEEDCDWAVLCHLDRNNFLPKYVEEWKVKSLSKEAKDMTVEGFYGRYVLPTLTRYHNGLLVPP